MFGHAARQQLIPAARFLDQPRVDQLRAVVVRVVAVWWWAFAGPLLCVLVARDMLAGICALWWSSTVLRSGRCAWQ
jgi:hypothetical protein